MSANGSAPENPDLIIAGDGSRWRVWRSAAVPLVYASRVWASATGERNTSPPLTARAATMEKLPEAVEEAIERRKRLRAKFRGAVTATTAP